MKPDPKRAAVLLTCLARPLDEAPRLVLSDLFERIGEDGRAQALRRNGYWHVDQNGTVTWRTGRTSRPRWYIGRAGPKPDRWAFVTLGLFNRLRPVYSRFLADPVAGSGPNLPQPMTGPALPWWVCSGPAAVDPEPRHLTFSATTRTSLGDCDGWRCQVCVTKLDGPAVEGGAEPGA